MNGAVATIRVPPAIVDKALAVAIDEERGTIAVWKGRGRIDIYDLSGTWHEISHPYPRHEEGLWSRDDVMRFVAEALAGAEPPPIYKEVPESTVALDVAAVCRAQLIRATALGSAMWQGGESIDVYSASGSSLRSVRVPPSDLVTISQLMNDLLELCELLLDQHAAHAAPMV